MTLLDQAIAEAYASAPQDTIILHTLEINHKSFTTPVRVANWPVTDNDPTVFPCLLEPDAPYDPDRMVEFIGLPFESVLPEQASDNPGNFRLRVDNVGDTLDEHLEGAVLAGGSITAVYREYIKGTEAEGPRSFLFDIKIKSPRMEGQTILSDGAILDWMQKPFGYLYTPEGYPTLVRGR